MYELPFRFALDETTPFWELVFCYGHDGLAFEITISEFRANDRYLLDSKTLKKYIDAAINSTVLTELRYANDVRYMLVSPAHFSEPLLKPQEFVLNDWLNRLIACEPLGTRALWLLNMLIHDRQEQIHKLSYLTLSNSLRSVPFRYSLPELQKAIENVRGKKTESPKEALQVLWKLGIVIPLEQSAFSFPKRQQLWTFYIDYRLFEKEAFGVVGPAKVLSIALGLLCQLLNRLRKKLESVGYDINAKPFFLPLQYYCTFIARLLSESGQTLPTGVNLYQLIRDFCIGLSGSDIIRLVKNSRVSFISDRIEDPHETRSVSQEIIRKHLNEVSRIQLNDIMKPFLNFRNNALATIVLNIAHDAEMAPQDCADFFLYLQKYVMILPESSYPLFEDYCSKYRSLLQLGVGYRQILDGFVSRTHKKRLKNPLTRIIRDTRMTSPHCELSVTLPLSRYPSSPLVLRTIISASNKDSPISTHQLPISFEFWQKNDRLICVENIIWFGLQKEELPPKMISPSDLLHDDISIKILIGTTSPLPDLLIRLIFEFGFQE